MTRDINDFFTFFRQKNGRVKISYKEGNIYKLLHEIGYGKTKLNNKRIYFLREKNDLTIVNLFSIKDTFKKMLESKIFTNLQTDIDYSDILELYYRKNPIKDNGLFELYLVETLTENETHRLRLRTDSIYEAQHLLSKFNEWGFHKCLDVAGCFGKGKMPHPLYYKKIGDKKYLVFNQSKSTKNMAGVFDCCIAIFDNETHLGNQKALDTQKIQDCFHLEKDFELISKYIN